MPPPCDPGPCTGSACGARNKAGFFAKAVKAATCTRGVSREICLCEFCAGRTRLAAHEAGFVQEFLDERRGGAIIKGKEAWEAVLSETEERLAAVATFP